MVMRNVPISSTSPIRFSVIRRKEEVNLDNKAEESGD
jgi:hypothetical protein